jgi:exodeoxyribonuclease-5
MSVPSRPLADDAARAVALTRHDRSLLVEAGAGSGKTAVLAGRIALVLAAGTAPSAIAAVTFTELAASELLARVQEMVGELLAGGVPAELRVALPDGLSPQQASALAAGGASLDEITCSTIHGFCQRLIRPYPVEADIDPGASVMDPGQVELVFGEIVDGWLRERLSGADAGLVGELVFQDPGHAVALVHGAADGLRKRPQLTAPTAAPIGPLVQAFRDASAAYSAFVAGCVAPETDTVDIAARFAGLAADLDYAVSAEDPATLVRLLATRPDDILCTAAGSFRKYQKKGKWAEAAKLAGLSKIDGEGLNLKAEPLHLTCCEAWTALLQNTAARVLHDLVTEVRQTTARFRDHKRRSALLDFDDLIFAARDLLRRHAGVRAALAGRYAHILVDEFQDTDRAQCEIFWRLCSVADPSAAGDWAAAPLRPGSLFLVGDPKQAIYRFRGADVQAYLQARAAIEANTPDDVISIATNFRSCAAILEFVNARFAEPLTAEGQPGFTALDPFHTDPPEGLCVTALDISVADADGKAPPDRQRDAEAEAVAETCARLIGSQAILDRRTGEARTCRPGDIALLAPTGADLWRYEEALERRGVPVSTQAGKGFFRRQEVQDLIALTRVLADSRDTLALGALLRGPLVGLAEEEILDLVWAAPRADGQLEQPARLSLHLDPAGVAHPLARHVLETLQMLRRVGARTTPHDLLARAVDALRLRAVLLRRHHGQAERALANVDAYLAMAAAYDVRGLRAFAEMVRAAWEDETRAVEGRPDAQEEAVALYTMHAAKGLEWPVVIPINTMTQVKSADADVVEREAECFLCPVLGVAPAGYDAAREAEKAELQRERVRLWYVAATRARQLLALPRSDVAAAKSAWSALIDLDIAALPPLDLAHLPLEFGLADDEAPNAQTCESFAREAEIIVEATPRLRRLAPSRDESPTAPLTIDEVPQVRVEGTGDTEDAVDIGQGGRLRGLLIHKLIEEVLTGETPDAPEALAARARDLIAMTGEPAQEDPAAGLSPADLAACVSRALAVPQVAAVRDRLVPEAAVYGGRMVDDVEQITIGVADALALTPEGAPALVIDWKSDVTPGDEAVEHYAAQVRAYMACVGAPAGLVVFVSTGQTVEIAA